MTKLPPRQAAIVSLIEKQLLPLSSSNIFNALKKSQVLTEVTLKRDLSALVGKGVLLRSGKGRAEILSDRGKHLFPA